MSVLPIRGRYIPVALVGSLSQCHYLLYTLLSTTQKYKVKEWGWFFQINVFHQNFLNRFHVLFCLPSWYRLHAQIRIVLLLGWRMNIPNVKLFPNRVPKEFSQIAFPTVVLPEGDRTNSLGEERLDLPYWTMILANLCFGKRIQISGHSDFGIFNNVGASSILTWVYAGTASAACPAHPGSLDILSMTFASVICDADDPCSVNTSYAP